MGLYGGRPPLHSWGGLMGASFQSSHTFPRSPEARRVSGTFQQGSGASVHPGQQQQQQQGSVPSAYAHHFSPRANGWVDGASVYPGQQQQGSVPSAYAPPRANGWVDGASSMAFYVPEQQSFQFGAPPGSRGVTASPLVRESTVRERQLASGERPPLQQCGPPHLGNYTGGSGTNVGPLSLPGTGSGAGTGSGSSGEAGRDSMLGSGSSGGGGGIGGGSRMQWASSGSSSTARGSALHQPVMGESTQQIGGEAGAPNDPHQQPLPLLSEKKAAPGPPDPPLEADALMGFGLLDDDHSWPAHHPTDHSDPLGFGPLGDDLALPLPPLPSGSEGFRTAGLAQGQGYGVHGEGATTPMAYLPSEQRAQHTSSGHPSRPDGDPRVHLPHGEGLPAAAADMDGSLLCCSVFGLPSHAPASVDELPSNETFELSRRLVLGHSLLQSLYEASDLSVQHRQAQAAAARSIMHTRGGGGGGGGPASGQRPGGGSAWYE